MRTAGFLIALVLISFTARTQQLSADSAAAKKIAPSRSITYSIFPADSQTFGYDIFVDGKKYIHQPTIPTLTGTKGFSSKTDAARVAEFVITKIKKGIMPPAVTSAELTALGIRVN